MSDERYEIVTLADFAKVPEDRLADCLRDFSAWIALTREIAALADPHTRVVERFVWIDDGIEGLSGLNIRFVKPSPEAPHD